ncbi:MAG: hypothetical protein GY940_38290 [bacterium]|nr:hypothetical protein [bacterium]
MKPKPINKKLTLNKETIANLNSETMLRLRAGYRLENTEPKSEGGVSVCMGKYTCHDSRCPIVTCTCKPTEDPQGCVVTEDPDNGCPVTVDKF